MWVAIDVAYQPGKRLAYAGVEGDRVVFVTSTNTTGEAAVTEIQAFVRDALRYGQSVAGIVLERPYYRHNLEVFRRFAVISGQFRQFCQQMGLLYAEVMPAHWKRSYLQGSGISARSQVANALFTAIARELIGHAHFSDDERDAVLMGLYFSRRVKRREDNVK